MTRPRRGGARQALELDPTTGITRSRHLVLSAWTAMIGGDLAGAGTILDGLPTDRALPAREAFFLHGLRIGSPGARATSEHCNANGRRRSRSSPVLCRSLFGLLPLGELWLAAVRLGDEHASCISSSRHRTCSSGSASPRCGVPRCTGTGGTGRDPRRESGALLPHARALAASAEVSSYAAGLAAAGRVWLRVLREEAEAAEVEAAGAHARPHRTSLGRSTTRRRGGPARVRHRGATALLQVARSLRGAAAAQSGGEITATDPAVGTLTAGRPTSRNCSSRPHPP